MILILSLSGSPSKTCAAVRIESLPPYLTATRVPCSTFGFSLVITTVQEAVYSSTALRASVRRSLIEKWSIVVIIRKPADRSSQVQKALQKVTGHTCLCNPVTPSVLLLRTASLRGHYPRNCHLIVA